MLARVGIPPIYIKVEESGFYRNLLINAITKEEYAPIIRFYYCKICDSIIDLNLHYFKKINGEDDIGKKFILEKSNKS